MIDSIKALRIEKQYEIWRWEKEIPVGRGRMIGKGGEGLVYEYYGSLGNLKKERVIKITIDPHDGVKYSELEKLVGELIGINEKLPLVQVYAIGEMSDGAYWTIMEKLIPLSKKEIVDFEALERNYFGDRDYPRKGRSRAGNKRRKFLREIQELNRGMGLLHNDFAYFNVMKTSHGRWKMIDLESFVL